MTCVEFTPSVQILIPRKKKGEASFETTTEYMHACMLMSTFAMMLKYLLVRVCSVVGVGGVHQFSEKFRLDVSKAAAQSVYKKPVAKFVQPPYGG